MELSSDATLGSTLPTTLIFNPYFETTDGCTAGIPTKYPLLSLPIPKPSIIFRDNSETVPLCTSNYVLDIFSTIGLSARNPTSITWNINSVDSDTFSAEKVTLDSFVNTNFANMKYVMFDQAKVASLSGKVVEFTVTIVNFLGQSNTETTVVTFSSTKLIIVDGLSHSYRLFDNEDNKLFLSTRIPY